MFTIALVMMTVVHIIDVVAQVPVLFCKFCDIFCNMHLT